MTTTTESVAPSEIQPYLDHLEERVAHLPPEQQAELLDDLRSHLTEILSDDSGTSLADRIGAPESYVAELAASLGLDEAPSGPRAMRAVISALSDRLASLRRRDSWPEMRWALWTLRGTAIALFLTWYGLFPSDHNDWWFRIPAFALIAALIWGSVRVGSLGSRSRYWKRLSWALTAGGLIAAVSLAANVSARMTPTYYIERGYSQMGSNGCLFVETELGYFIQDPSCMPVLSVVVSDPEEGGNP